MTKFLNISVDNTLGGNSPSDVAVSSQKAVKEYIDAHSGGGGAAIDNLSITRNSSLQIQTVGVIDQNNTTNAIKTWTGTKAQYNAIASKDANTEYLCTDTGEMYLGTVKICGADLNGKADVDLSNVNVSGTSLASGWSMPSSRYIDLILGASGATYTAPANGYFYLQKIATSTTQVLLMVNNSKIGSIFTTNDTKRGVQGYIPVSKGDTLSVTYSLGGATTVFRFVYAEGEN